MSSKRDHVKGAVKDYRIKFPNQPDMNHVEAQVLDLVARLYPEIFSALDNYCTKNRAFLDETIGVFDREIQFYIAYLEHTALFKRHGLGFCYPKTSNTCKKVYDYEGFDLALAYKLLTEDLLVVCNDFHLNDEERIIVSIRSQSRGQDYLRPHVRTVALSSGFGLARSGQRSALVSV
jgi:hypothetical protein